MLVVALAVLAPAAAFLGGPASGTPTPPSIDDVERARRAAADGSAAVAHEQALLDAAADRADAAELRLAQAAEDYDAARITLQRRAREAAAAAAAADRADAEVARQRRELARLAVQQYRDSGTLSNAGLVLTAQDGEDPLAQVALLQAWATSRQQVLRRVEASVAVAEMLRRAGDAALADQRAAAASAEQTRRLAQAAATSAAAVRAEADAQHRSAIARLAELTHTSTQVQEARQAALVAQREQQREEQARQEARRRAAHVSPTRGAAASPARPRPQPPRGDGGAATTRPRPTPASTGHPQPSSRPAPRTTAHRTTPHRPVPPPAPDPVPDDGVPAGGRTLGSAADGVRAVAWARTQLGKPYEWAADGPDTYDCSGLTMRAWEAAGVSLSHSSRYQFRQVRKVPIAQARVGDLLFWASDPDDPGTIHHVALVAGGGLMVEAPETGKDVRVAPLRYRGLLPWVGRP
ncbi:MAG: C40 family peptidase [Kineosporiaceae bacterium]